MSTDATTLYKLMVLYMLDKVNFPLSNSQIADFMLDRQYTNYFTLQEVLSSLASDTVLCRFSHTEAARNISLLKKELIQFLFSIIKFLKLYVMILTNISKIINMI